ncbi:hypothetical protein [Spirosoma jeollabukense]
MYQDDEFKFDSIYTEVVSFPEFKLLFAQYKRAMHETTYRLNQPKPFFSIQQPDNRSGSPYRKAD